MAKKIKNILFILLMGIGLNANAQVYLDSLNKQSADMLVRFSKQDYKGLLNYTHPKVLELMGGEKQAIEILSKAMAELKNLKMTIKNAQIGEVVQLLKTDESIQCILPQMLEMEVGQIKAKSKNYLFGISYDGGKKWYFLDTAARKEEDLRKIIPEMNKDLVIPKSETTYN